MDWTDVLMKIGIGAGLGFGIIALAKLGRKKIDRDRMSVEQGRSVPSDGSRVPDDRNGTP